MWTSSLEAATAVSANATTTTRITLCARLAEWLSQLLMLLLLLQQG